MNELIIDIDDLKYNINLIKSKEKDDYTIIAVVKGNAYGCDLKQYVKVLKENGINFFAVASYEEALEFRKYFKDKLLLLTPYNDDGINEELIKNDITITIDSKNQAKQVNDISKKLNKKVVSHIKVETGLNRYGYSYYDTKSIIKTVNDSDNIEFEGIYSHLANSLASNNEYSILQYKRFTDVIDKLKNNKIDFKLKHICNSSGYFKYENMHLNAARIGSAFIGCATGIKTDLKKIGIFHTKITKILHIQKGEYIGYAKSYKAKKDMLIGILPTGYYDGVGKTLIDQRFLFKSKVKRLLVDLKKIFNDDNYKINGLKVVGQIGMHDIVIDITDKNYKINDDVFFEVRPTLIDSNVKRVYKKVNKKDI